MIWWSDSRGYDTFLITFLIHQWMDHTLDIPTGCRRVPVTDRSTLERPPRLCIRRGRIPLADPNMETGASLR